MSFSRVVIVGASLAGLSAAEKLRELGYDEEIVLIGGEDEDAYDRPPLSKQIITGEWAPERTRLRPIGHYAALNIDHRPGVWAQGLDLRAQEVDCGPDGKFIYDRLIIATGSSVRELSLTRGFEEIYYLRTLKDSLALASALDRHPKLVVIGGGFIGAEIASSARARGIEVTLIETQPRLMSRVLGPKAAAHSAGLHIDHGVNLRLGVAVAEVLGERTVEGLKLSDGSIVGADAVVVGIGADPCTGWLTQSGLALDNGVVCDAFCFAAPNVVAAGDVARWVHPLYGSVRLEHWTNAVEQGRAAAKNLLINPELRKPFGPTGYVWSDQYGQKIQLVGDPSPTDDERIVQKDQAGRVAALYGRAGQFRAAVTYNWPQMLVACRRLLAEGANWGDAQMRAAAA
jgi:NADPH-dependent 2,4-dienoyl-CoA reductase/sulfur reductase-like enzyme